MRNSPSKTSEQRSSIQRPLRWQKRLLFLPALCALCLLLLGAAAPPMSRAASVSAQPRCRGYHCDDLDPYQSLCAGQSWDQVWVVETAPIKNQQGRQIGYTQLWWSNTCQTNWARVVAQVPHLFIAAQLDVQWGGNEWDSGGSVGSLISAQFYAPIALAGAFGEIDVTRSSSFSSCASQDFPAFCG